MEKKTGWERENRTIFDENVQGYDKTRWEYPAALYDDIFMYAGADGKRALEIGAGTGKATAPFLRAGYDVTAVEIGENMAAFLADTFRKEPGFRVIVSSFEKAELPEDGFDLVYAATAFHWVDAKVGCPKVLRLLKDGGVFALFRYRVVPPEEGAPHEALYREIQQEYDKHYYCYYKPGNRPVRIPDADYRKPDAVTRSFSFESLEGFGFRDVTMRLHKGSRSYGADEYLSLLDTYSDHRALPEENRAALYAGIKDAIQRHGGELRLDLVYQLYMGRK